MIVKKGKYLAVIPARGGSKGIPRKNLKPFCGKPLLAWTIETALATPGLDQVIVSTEDAEIAEVARQYGADVPFLRPAKWAEDDVSATEALLHALRMVQGCVQLAVLLQPTSPLRLPEDILACLEACGEEEVKAAVSVAATGKSPAWMYALGDNGLLAPLLGEDKSELQRQQLPKAYVPNGAVYVARAGWLSQSRSFFGPQTRGCVMPPERSLDIDTPLDFQLAEWLMRERLHGSTPLSPT
ncbi:MAG: acylneuraminate cytidylyltransferase family protein [Magnetococcales bacterium]|nr:acylneuraminate cytidylyltransferase family protein [Magnetococcales bacterium]